MVQSVLYTISQLTANYEELERHIEAAKRNSEMANIKKQIVDLINQHRKEFLN